MTVEPRPVTLGDVTSALDRGRSADAVLDLADEMIDHASEVGDGASLVELAAVLDAASRERHDARGFTIAARRASLTAAALGASPVTRPAAEGAPVAPALDTTPSAAPDAAVQGGAVGVARYSGWWRRVLAFLVDWLVLSAVFLAVPAEASDTVWLLAVFGLPLAYFGALLAFSNGRTIGKAVFGIAVRRENGEPVDLAGGLARALVQGLLWVTVVGGVVDSLMPLGDRRKRSAHDRAAGTVVVRVR